MIIDTTTYNKAALYSPGTGYGPITQNGPAQRKPEEINAIIVHTTNGSKGTAFENEANYIYRSKDISAHFLVGKSGQVVQFLDPVWIAWHAGYVNDPDCDNYNAIGVENHFTPGEQWTDEMYSALTSLVMNLLQRYPSIRKIVTHREVAIFPPGSPHAGELGRKVDPSGWTDADFETWSELLLHPTAPPVVSPLGTILAPASKTQGSVVSYTIDRSQRSGYTSGDVLSIIASYWRYGLQAGVDPALLVAQMLHETGFLSSWWAARPRRNPAGIGVNGQTMAGPPPNLVEWQYDAGHNEWKHGYAFRSWDEAAKAHTGHLLCYALEDCNMTPIQLEISNASPRKDAIPPSYRGSAENITDLNGKWAVPGLTYGQRILAILQDIP